MQTRQVDCAVDSHARSRVPDGGTFGGDDTFLVKLSSKVQSSLGLHGSRIPGKFSTFEDRVRHPSKNLCVQSGAGLWALERCFTSRKLWGSIWMCGPVSFTTARQQTRRASSEPQEHPNTWGSAPHPPHVSQHCPAPLPPRPRACPRSGRRRAASLTPHPTAVQAQHKR